MFQRPQHLMRRMARQQPVYFFEEPILEAGPPRLELNTVEPGLTVATPYLPPGLAEAEAEAIAAQRRLLDGLCEAMELRRPLLWYYSPMSARFSDHLEAERIVYDCMDELSAFRGAPPGLVEEERRLMRRADVVFTGGQSLFEAKRRHHANVWPFPSSVDVAHFRAAREPLPEPADQAALPRPRIGHYAVLDERLDTALLAAIAEARPDWQLVLVGPVVKIAPEDLPRRPNIHYLGMKSYAELPAYLSGWDATFMPFARNDSTRFISPTKTPEYLAAGRPVVSTPVADVVRTYGQLDMVRIAEDAAGFVAALEDLLGQGDRRAAAIAQSDRLLAAMSWDATWAQMRELLA
ncbi:MAG: glycosyltransferase [Geminicoccaceae bacterium]